MSDWHEEEKAAAKQNESKLARVWTEADRQCRVKASEFANQAACKASGIDLDDDNDADVSNEDSLRTSRIYKDAFSRAYDDYYSQNIDNFRAELGRCL